MVELQTDARPGRGRLGFASASVGFPGAGLASRRQFRAAGRAHDVNDASATTDRSVFGVVGRGAAGDQAS